MNMNIKNVALSALMLSIALPNSFAVAYSSDNPSVEATKMFFGFAAGAVVMGTGTVAGAIGGGIAGGVAGMAKGSSYGPVGSLGGAVIGVLGGAAAGGTAGFLTGAAVISALFDEKEKRNDKNENNKKEELKEALHKKN